MLFLKQPYVILAYSISCVEVIFDNASVIGCAFVECEPTHTHLPFVPLS